MPTPPVTDSLFDLLLIGAYRSTVAGQQVRTNLALARLNGYDREAEALVAMNDLSQWYVEPDRRDAFVMQMREFGYVTNFISEVYQHKTRKRIWVSETAHVIRNEHGDVLMLEGTVEDITERLRTEQLLRESERRFRALTEGAQVATAIVEVDGRVLYASASVWPLLGVTPEALIGTNLFATMHEDDLLEHRDELNNVTQRKNTGRESVARHRHSDGTYRYIASVASDCSDDPAVGGIVVNWRDVTKRMRDQELLKVLAKTDALTQLNNRMHFEQLCEARLSSGAPSAQRFAMLFIDLNRFKLVNDAHGHRVGDAALREVAQRLQSVTKPDDTLARLGGDEFGLMMPMRDDGDEAAKASQLLAALADPLLVLGMSFDLGARSLSDLKSIGCKFACPAHISPVFWAISRYCRCKTVKICPRAGEFSLRCFKPDRLLASVSPCIRTMRIALTISWPTPISRCFLRKAKALAMLNDLHRY